MNNTLFDRRRGERFAQLLEELDDLGRAGSAASGNARRSRAVTHRHRLRSVHDRDLAPLVTLSSRLRTMPLAATPGSEFRTSLRAMVVATAEREGIGVTAVDAGEPGPVRRSAGRVRRTRLNLVVGVAAGALVLSGVSTASGDAKPGDALYQVKRSTERTQLALAGSDSARGHLYLDFARVRLDEAVKVSPGLLPDVLLDMDIETRQGARLLATAAVDGRDLQRLAAIEMFVAAQRKGLMGLLDGLPADGRARATESVQVLDAVTDRVTALRAGMACGSPNIALDELGPVPSGCR